MSSHEKRMRSAGMREIQEHIHAVANMQKHLAPEDQNKTTNQEGENE
jgi:hypothetical protein